jgi:hypothetical protein
MAGDWIKMRNDLRSDPAVFKLAALTGLDRFAVVGRLAEFWGWVDKHAVDGFVDGGTSQAIDDVVVYEGFSEALVQVHWLVITDSGIEIPKHELHNSDSAKERSLKNERQARWRAKKAAESALESVDVLPSTSASTREEKRREEKKTDTSPAKLPTCPTQTLIDLYHEILPELPRAVLLTVARKKALAKTWAWVLTSTKAGNVRRATTADEAVEWFRGYFTRARDNDFLMGRGHKSPGHEGWECSLDFLLTDKGMAHVIEKTRDAA